MDHSQQSHHCAIQSCSSSISMSSNTTPTRVHFNPVVSKLRYRQLQEDYPHRYQGHNPRRIANGKIVTQDSEEEKVQKVFVTIAIASPPPPCQRVFFHGETDNGKRKFDISRHNVPDLLKSTPLTERKQYMEKMQSERYCAKELEKQKLQLSYGKNVSSSLSSDRSCVTCNTPSDDDNNAAKVSNKTKWTSGLVQQLASLKKFVVGEKKATHKMKQQPRGRRTSHSKEKKIKENSTTSVDTVDNNASAPVCLKTATGTNNVHPASCSSVGQQKPENENNYSITTPSPSNTRVYFDTSQSNNVDSVGMKPSVDKMRQSPYRGGRGRIMGAKNYQTEVKEGPKKDETTDEFSANVEKILEEIADLDDIMRESRTALLASAPIPQKSKADQIDELVNECCAVSSALSCLTASANSLVTPSTNANTQLPPRPPKLPNAALRDQFYQQFCFKSTRQKRLEPLTAERKAGDELGCKLSELKEELHRSRGKIARFRPEEIDNSVRRSMAIDRSICGRNLLNGITSLGWENQVSSLRNSNDHHSQDEDNQNWDRIVAEAKEKLVVSSSAPHNFNNEGDFGKRKCFILETDLDTGSCREVFKTDPSHAGTVFKSPRVVNPPRNLFDLSKEVQRNTCSMQNLNLDSKSTLTPTAPNSKEERSRSMEFLLDDEKQAKLMPPENSLKKRNDNRQVSEHELRIQRSLQRLNVPDWYKNYATPGLSGNKPSPSSNRDFGSGTGLAGGWSGLHSSKTSSLTSLQSAGRYPGSKTQFSSARYKGTASAGGRSSRESLMSPSSTASASPSPYFERSSFTYGMPYALSRFATSRMSCGASPASLSPSPSPVGGITSSTSTPVSSGPMARYGYNKTPYLGWRSQERLNQKTLYRSPSERLAADLLAQKQKVPTTPVSTASDISIVTSPRKETASDLSLNISDTSESSNKLNRVRSSIKEVSNAIVDYVNESKPLDDAINGRASPRRGLIWLESSFVGTKPIDSPGTPDTPNVILSKHLGAQSAAYLHNKRSSMKLDHNGDNNNKEASGTVRSSENSQAFSTYLSRNEKMGEGSNSSSVSSPTLDDILDSLLALRRPHKKNKVKGHKATTKDILSPAATTATIASQHYEAPVSDWQERMNQPLDDTMYFPQDNDAFLLSNSNVTTTTTTTTTTGSNNQAQDINEYACFMHALNKNDTGDATSAAVNQEPDGAKSHDSPWMDTSTATTTTTDSLALGSMVGKEPSDDDISGRIAQEEYNFGTPTEIQPTMPTLIYNPLAGLGESNSNPTTPARHRRVSFDLDVSDKEDKSSSRSKRDESVGGSIQCKNSKCAKTATGLEARREFKTCHNCNAYYCSRECRRTHWEKHKKVCMQSRVGQLCKQIIQHVKDDSFVVSQLSTVAKRGFLAKSRGCVKLFFSSPDRAERFLSGGIPELPEPWYIPHADMLPEEMELSESCRTYNPETRFVLYASVCIVNEVPTSGAVKWEREMISRSSKIRLLLPRSYDENQPHHHAANPAHLNPEDINPSRAFSPSTVGHQDEDGTVPSSGDNETLILRSVPTPASLKLNRSEDRRRREISFTNIQKHLIERGVDLRRTYPDIYSKLCNYVENDEPFLPVTIYPRNSETGNQFMCVIMPESSDTTYALSTEIVDPSKKVETINISE